MLEQLIDLAGKSLFMMAYGAVIVALWWAGEQIYDRLKGPAR